jgi:methionyl-tRNA synthetase
VKRPFFVTTPIYYVNDQPHIGHVYTTVAADAAARYHRSAGREVFFLTGVDEHGQKVEQAARERGLTPQEHCDRMVGRFTDLWERLAVSNDDFIRTTEGRHQETVSAFLNALHDNGSMYKASYRGWYCVPDERFWTEKDVPEGMCPDCGRPVARIEESNWFFRMGACQEWLVDHLTRDGDAVRPESRRNEMLGFLRRPLGDLCISRPRARLSWGIPLPFDPDYVTYVWFDALVNYATASGFLSDPARFARLWPEAVHLIGKDILVPHAVYWPTMLRAMRIDPPRRVYAHGWWTIEGRKMSKSLGNVVDPHRLIDEYGADALRYFLLREIPFGADGDFSKSAMIGRINSDLANDLGNLFSRTLGMLERYRGGVVPPWPRESGAAAGGAVEGELAEKAGSAARELSEHMEDLAFHRALGAVWELVAAANRLVDSSAPWALSRRGEEKALDSVMCALCETLRHTAVMAAPFLPATGAEMLRRLGVAERPGLCALASLRWGELPPGTRTSKGDALFPRIDASAKASATAGERGIALTSEEAKPATAPAPVPSAQPTADFNLVSLDDVRKVHLVAAVIIEAERVPKSRKLIRLLIDCGERRQIVAGIGERYAPEDLLGKRIAVVTNLPPAVLMGVESRGMLLAATDGTGIHLVTFDAPVAPGSRIK